LFSPLWIRSFLALVLVIAAWQLLGGKLLSI
jgi:hypothetical protein